MVAKECCRGHRAQLRGGGRRTNLLARRQFEEEKVLLMRPRSSGTRGPEPECRGLCWPLGGSPYQIDNPARNRVESLSHPPSPRFGDSEKEATRIEECLCEPANQNMKKNGIGPRKNSFIFVQPPSVGHRRRFGAPSERSYGAATSVYFCFCLPSPAPRHAN